MRTVGRFVVACIVLTASAASHAALNVQWEQIEGKDLRIYNPSAIAAGPENSLFVAGTSAGPGLDGREPEFWLWKLNATGKRVKETLIARAEGAQQITASVDYVRDMVFESGRGAMVVDFNLGEPYFVSFDGGANLTTVKRLDLAGRSRVFINQLIPLSNGGFMAVGTAEGAALTARIDAEGTVTDSATTADVDVFTGGAALPGGGFVVLGYQNARRGQFVLAYYGPGALFQRSAVFAGRKASIAVGADGTQVIVYDASKDHQQDLRIAVVKGAALANEIAVPIVARSFDEDFHIAPAKGGRFLIAGSTQDSIVVLDFGVRGILSRFERTLEEQPHHWMLTRVVGDPAVVLTSVYTGDKELTTKVGVIRFSVD